MTLDEAIEKELWGATEQYNASNSFHTAHEVRLEEVVCRQKAEYHEQIAEWLKELKQLREQEPFINKPCVAHQVCHEDKVKALDKMEAEFISLYPLNYAGELELGGISCEFSLNQVLKIIDKYKAESEE